MYSISLCFVWLTFFVIVISSEFSHSLRNNDGGALCDGEGWSGYLDEKCYKLIKKWATRDEAQNVCSQEELESDGSIPQLAIIRSSTEQAFLTAYVFDTSAVTISVWIGAKRQNGSNFIWDDGTDVEGFTNWTEDSPSDKIQQSCVVMKSDYMKAEPKSSTAGQWRDVPCEMPNYVLCEKPQRWSIAKLQQTQLELRKELKESNELHQKQLEETKDQLSQSTNRLIEEAKDKLVPIGFLYTQLPHQKAPSEIWPWMTWTDVSYTYSGVFFRVEGGGSASFGQLQQETFPRVDQFTVYMDGPSVTLNSYSSRNSEIPGGIRSFYSYMNGIELNTTVEEVRPRNMAVRLWKRFE